MYIASMCHVVGSLRGPPFGQKDKKPSTPSALSGTAKLEHSLVLQSLQECIGPRLSSEVSPMRLEHRAVSYLTGDRLVL